MRAKGSRNTIPIGTTSLAVPHADALANVRFAIGILDFVEVTFDYPAGTLPPSKGFLKELEKMRKDGDLFFTVHMPLNIHLASPCPAIRRASIEEVKAIVEAVHPYLEPRAYTFHLTPISGIPIPQLGPQFSLRLRLMQEEAAGESLSEIAGVFDKLSIPRPLICIENVFNVFPMADRFVEEFGFSVTFDVGHYVLDGGNPLEFIMRWKEKIRVLHLHNVVDGLDHQPLDVSGRVDVPAVTCAIRMASPGAMVVLEVFGKEAVKRSVALLRDLLKEEDL